MQSDLRGGAGTGGQVNEVKELKRCDKQTLLSRLKDMEVMSCPWKFLTFYSGVSSQKESLRLFFAQWVSQLSPDLCTWVKI